MEYYGIAHVLPRYRKCSSHKQLRECDKEKVSSSHCIVGHTNASLCSTQRSLVHVAAAQYCAVHTLHARIGTWRGRGLTRQAPGCVRPLHAACASAHVQKMRMRALNNHTTNKGACVQGWRNINFCSRNKGRDPNLHDVEVSPVWLGVYTTFQTQHSHPVLPFYPFPTPPPSLHSPSSPAQEF